MKLPAADDLAAPAPEPEETKTVPPLPVIASADLLHGSRKVFIAHGGRIYTLQVTRGDKLILTK